MKARPRRRTASSRGSNQSPPAKGDGDVAAADVASVMAWVPSRSCRSEPTPPQLFPTNLAPRPPVRRGGNQGRSDPCGAWRWRGRSGNEDDRERGVVEEAVGAGVDAQRPDVEVERLRARRLEGDHPRRGEVQRLRRVSLDYS